MKDIVTLSDLRVPVCIGVFGDERAHQQTLSITISFKTDAHHVAKTDELSNAIDYSKIYQVVLAYSKRNQFCLLETFAARLSDELMQHFQLPWLQIIVTKYPQDMPEVNGGVSIQLEKE